MVVHQFAETARALATHSGFSRSTTAQTTSPKGVLEVPHSFATAREQSIQMLVSVSEIICKRPETGDGICEMLSAKWLAGPAGGKYLNDLRGTGSTIDAEQRSADDAALHRRHHVAKMSHEYGTGSRDGVISCHAGYLAAPAASAQS